MKAQFGRLGRSRRVVMRERLLVIGGSTLLFCIVAISFLAFYSKTTEARPDNQFQPKPAAGDDTAERISVMLLAPAEQVPPGTKLSKVKGMIQEVYWPRDKVPQGAIRQFDDVGEMFAKVALPAGQPILRDSLTSTPPQNGIDNALPEGHRAVTIEVDAVSGIEGWATPGVHVDLYLTYLDPESSENTTRVAVEDAIVMSYNGRTERRGDDGDRQVSRMSSSATVTLAVPFEDSLKIQTARAMGRLTMALRNPEDVKSRGLAEFRAQDFRTNRKEDKKNNRSQRDRGFAMIKDPSTGKERQFNLDGSGKWMQQADDFDG